MSNPLVSVITPCYNDGEFLLQTIVSIRDSTYPNIEHLVINDGSTDPYTLRVLQQVDGMPRVYVINTVNQGVCKARNQAVKISKGEFILFLDADDIITKDYIALSVEVLMQKESVSVVTSDYCCFGKMNFVKQLKPFSMGDLLSCNQFVISSFFRRIDYDRINGFNENMNKGLEDWDFWLGILSLGGTVHILQGVHFYYRIKTRTKSRNLSIDQKTQAELRYNIWNNHKELYSIYYMDLFKSAEYLLLLNSMEYRIGKILLKPIRYILGK